MTHHVVNVRANDKTFAATGQTVVDSDNVTRLYGKNGRKDSLAPGKAPSTMTAAYENGFVRHVEVRGGDVDDERNWVWRTLATISQRRS